MEKLKISPINSILGRYFHDKVTDVNPPTYQKQRESNHCTFMNVTALMLSGGKQGYKFDKL